MYGGSEFPTLLEVLGADPSEDEDPHVINACHLLASAAIPCALCEIFVAACKQRIIPTTCTMVET